MTCLCEKIAGQGVELSPVCLGHLWIFENLSPTEVAALNEEAVRRKVTAGSPLFMQGDPANEMFLIKGGRVKLSKVFEDGSEITLDIRKAGDFVGENMLAEDGLYPVSAYCLEDSLCCGFSRSRFEQLILDNPGVGLQIIRNLSERITSLTTRVGNMSTTSIEDRLIRVVADVAREHGAPCEEGLAIEFPLTHEDLSFLIGAHRVSISRAVKNLKKAGKLITTGRYLIVPDQQGGVTGLF